MRMAQDRRSMVEGRHQGRNGPKPRVNLAAPAALANAEHAVQQLRAAIVAGSLRPGDRLIEAELADQLNMSRHPIREALRQLNREGLVELRPNRGARVAEVEPQDILEVYEIRAALGAVALRHLLLREGGPTPEQMAKLEELADRVHRYALNEDQERTVANDLEFQAAIVEASGLARVETYFRNLAVDVTRFINSLEIEYVDKPGIAGQVRALLDAIRAGDLPRAERVWHRNFVRSARSLLALFPDAEGHLRQPRWLLTAGGSAEGVAAPPVRSRKHRG
jgi:GntR family transcriptional regulator, trigonelline degradation regulator